MVDSGYLFVLTARRRVWLPSNFSVQFPGFTMCWPFLAFLQIFSGRDNAVYHSGRYKPQSRTIMWSRESLPSTVNLFGGQSGRLKAFQAFQATMGSNVGRLYFGSWILKASKHFRNHWIHCLAPLNFGSWTLEGFSM